MGKKEDFILVELTMPPSMNKLFAWKVRRTKSDEYKWRLNLAFVEYNNAWYTYKIIWDEWLEVHLNYFFPLYTEEGEKKIKDTANFEKATIDFLCTKIPWLQDHKIKRIIQEKHDSDKNIVKILIKEIPDGKKV